MFSRLHAAGPTLIAAHSCQAMCSGVVHERACPITTGRSRSYTRPAHWINVQQSDAELQFGEHLLHASSEAHLRRTKEFCIAPDMKLQALGRLLRNQGVPYASS